jgi:hypothetical protein
MVGRCGMKFVFQLILALAGFTGACAQTVTIVPSATTYKATGGEITFAVTIDYPGVAASIGVEVRNVPIGWAMGTVGGANPPQITAKAGDTAPLDFAYTAVPSSPVNFTFSVSYASGLGGNQTLSGNSASMRDGTGSLKIVTLPDIVFTPEGTGGGTSPVAPAIVIQPTGGSADEGLGFTFSVTASGTPPLAEPRQPDRIFRRKLHCRGDERGWFGDVGSGDAGRAHVAGCPADCDPARRYDDEHRRNGYAIRHRDRNGPAQLSMAQGRIRHSSRDERDSHAE